MADDILHRWILELLRPLTERWLRERGGLAFVGSQQFIYYRQHDPHSRVRPDLYVLSGVAPNTHVRAWKTWETTIAPSFALAIARQDWERDYVETPERCDKAGIAELIVFDPSWADRPGAVGVRWQVYRRTRKRGLRRLETTNEDRVWARALGGWLRTVGAGQDLRLRIASGKRGDHLVPTAEEAERAEKEAALARLAAIAPK